MWLLLMTTLPPLISSRISETNTILSDAHIIFSSNFNITRVLVPADRTKLQVSDNETPTIFFTISDPGAEGGSCIYVLEGLVAYEILEGGTDSTSSYDDDKEVYFGSKDGLYKFEAATVSAKKYGPFHDNIVQLQKAKGVDEIFVLNNKNEIYKIERNGTSKTKMADLCAEEFVLDTSNNLYYLSCRDRVLRTVKYGSFTAVTMIEDFGVIKLVRPPFVSEDCVPFFGDQVLYLFYSNGTSEKKDFEFNIMPTALSVDATMYIVAAFGGKMYEFNVFEVMMKSMFRNSTTLSTDGAKIVSMILQNSDNWPL